MPTEIVKINEYEFERSKALKRFSELMECSKSEINEVRYLKAPTCNMAELYSVLSVQDKHDIVDELRCYEHFKNIHQGTLAFTPITKVVATLAFPPSPFIRWNLQYNFIRPENVVVVVND